MPYRTESVVAPYSRIRAFLDARTPRPTDAVPVTPPQTVDEWPTDPHEVLDAFCGEAGARLVGGEGAGLDVVERDAIRRARRTLRQLGYDDEAMCSCGLGVYTTPQEVHAYLRTLGFSEEAVRRSRLVFDTDGRPRTDWIGRLIVPQRNEVGRVVDVWSVEPERLEALRSLHGDTDGSVALDGVHELTPLPADRAEIVLVEGVFEALLLRRQGFENAVALGDAVTALTTERWQALARAGVRTVTLVAGRDRTDTDVRHSLANALLARTAPEVYVATNGGSVPSAVRSANAFAQRLQDAQHAFCGKDYGSPGDELRLVVRRTNRAVAQRLERTATSAAVVEPRRSYADDLLGRVERIAHPAERAAWRWFVGDVDRALKQGDVDEARRLSDHWYARLGYEVTPAQRIEETAVFGTFVADTFTGNGHHETTYAGLGANETNRIASDPVPPRTLDLEFRALLREWITTTAVR